MRAAQESQRKKLTFIRGRADAAASAALTVTAPSGSKAFGLGPYLDFRFFDFVVVAAARGVDRCGCVRRLACTRMHRARCRFFFLIAVTTFRVLGSRAPVFNWEFFAMEIITSSYVKYHICLSFTKLHEDGPFVARGVIFSN